MLQHRNVLSLRQQIYPFTRSCTMCAENLGLYDFLTTRRKDPNYAQVTSHIPKELAKRLKIYCTEEETTITEAVETAIEEFLDKRQRLPGTTSSKEP